MVEIDKKLYQEIKDYCKLNNLVIKDFVSKLLRKAFTIEKYGDRPFAENNITVGNDTTQKLRDSVFAKTEVNPSYYGELKTDNRVIGKMELPDEPPYNNVMVTTEHINDLETQAIEKIKDLVENQVSVPAEIREIVDEHFFDMLGDEKPVKTEEPKVVKKSRKRKLN